MTNTHDPVMNPPSSYERIGRRIQRMVAAPGVQKIQSVTVIRRDDEPVDVWETVLEEIEETDGIRVERLEDGSVWIGWRKYIDN